MLVMASDYHPDPGWLCTACRAIGIEVPETPVCPHCGESAVRSMDVREALLRLAGQLERPVEVVGQSDALMSLGGVGCLLRYRSEPDWLPWFTCKAVGDVISETARTYPDTEFLVLCGHTHSPGRYAAEPNVLVLTAGADYGRPKVQGIVEVDDGFEVQGVG